MYKLNEFFRKIVSGKGNAEKNTVDQTTETAETKKTAANHVLSGKSAAKIHPENPFEKSAKDSELLGVYSDSDKLLQPKPLAEDLSGINAILGGYIAFYSAVSVLSAGAVGFYGSDFILPVSPELSVLSGITSALFALILAGINEKIKIFGLTRYFKPRPAQRNASLVPLLLITAVISIVISAAGGALISYNLTDKTAEIQTNQFAQIDSINAVFDGQLTALQLASESAQNTLKQHKTGWRANIARQDLDKTATKISELQNSKAASLGTLQTVTTSAISQDTGKREKYAKISAAIVTVLELLFIAFHALYWSNIRKIKTEKENHISGESDGLIQMINPDTFGPFLGGFAGLQLHNANQYAPANDNRSNDTENTPKPNKIGFVFGTSRENDNSADDRADNRSGTNGTNGKDGTDGKTVILARLKPCENCGQIMTYKNDRKKWCSETCKLENYQKRTGKPFVKGGSVK